MPRNQAANRPGISEAKRTVLDLLKQGRSLAYAMDYVKRSPRSYEKWLSSDPSFKEQFEQARADVAAGNAQNPRDISFSDFRRKYLHSRTFPHQQNMIDVIEGRPPSWLHDAMKYERGDPQFVLINIPPDHAKTVTVSVDYVTYLLCTNPQNRIVIVSKTQQLATDMLWAIKQRLTHPQYADLQRDFGPPDGFKSGDAIWQQTRIYLSSDVRNPEEKDPSCQSLGIGGQIYGNRSTHIFVDDAVLLSNANQYESQRRWIEQEVVSRLGDSGKLVVVGTRVDTVDLYRELRNPDNFEEGKSPWTYLGMPAVLEPHDDVSKWVTLWPKSDRPWPGSKDLPDEKGLYPRWDGLRLQRRRNILEAKVWSMVYQQQDVSSDAIFDPRAVRACINGQRTVGPLQGGNKYHGRPEGMQGLHVICSMDPAMSGETASIAYAVDPRTLKRWVLDAHRMRSPSPQAIRDVIHAWTEKYEPSSWVIEKNAFQLYLTRDEQIRQFLANRGVAMLEHYTGSNKLDPDFGVASLAPLFTEQMIELPSAHNSEGVKALVEQLITWRPGAKAKDLIQDLPMALWMAEIKAREVVSAATLRADSFASSKYVPRYRRKGQAVIRIDDWLRQEDTTLSA